MLTKKINMWSGNQPEGTAHITDFQNIVPKIDYQKFEKYLLNHKKEIANSKNFLEFLIYTLKLKLNWQNLKKKINQ